MTNILPMPPRNRVQSIVKRLRAMIEEAERGEITAMASVVMRPGGDPSFYVNGSNWALLGAVVMLPDTVKEDMDMVIEPEDGPAA